MRNVLFIIIALASASTVRAQANKDEFKVMIDSAINIKYAQYKQATKNQNNKDYLENLYLLNDQNQPLNYLPSSNKFKSISVYDSRSQKIIKKGIYAWKVLPALSGNKLIINIIDFFITYKNNNYNFGNGGGSQIAFEYDCEKGIWRLISSQTKGN